MKNKKSFTFALIFVGFMALCCLATLESQLPFPITNDNYVPPTSSDQPMATMGDAPADPTAIDTTKETSYSTLLAAPNGCRIDQTTLEEWLTNLNTIFNNAITIASLMRGVSDNPHTQKYPDIAALLENNVMPQDVSRTCKALQERIEYLAKLTNALKKNMYTEIPSQLLS